MGTSVKAKLGALAAAAAIAGTGAATSGVASAAVHPAVTRLPTALSIHASAPVTRNHVTSARISGRLTSDHVPLSHKVVFLQRRVAIGHWVIVQKAVTNLGGRVSYLIHERKTSTFRLLFRGTRKYKRSVSPTVTVVAGH